jgi:hypothetical protein
MRSHGRPNIERGSRGTVGRNLAVLAIVAVLVVMNALAVQPAASQPQAQDAIVVDPNGRVGIGTAPDPGVALNVGGTIKSPRLYNGNKSLDVKGAGVTIDGGTHVIITGTNVGIAPGTLGNPGTLSLNGNLLMGDLAKREGAASPSQIRFTFGYSGFSNFNNNAEISNDISTDFGKALMLNGNSSRNPGRAPRWVQAWDNLEVISDLYVGAQGRIGNLKVNGGATVDKDLVVNGNTTINKELPPYTFEIGNRNDNNWHAIQVAGSIIREYLGDEDGGTIKMLLRQNDSDEVRYGFFTVYIEQPDRSNNRRDGLQGFTRQLGGGEWKFNLNTDDKGDIARAWDWLEVHNFQLKGNRRGLPSGDDGPRFRGNGRPPWDEYKLEFDANENICATIVIYDR